MLRRRRRLPTCCTSLSRTIHFLTAKKRIGCAPFLYFLERNGLLTSERAALLPGGMIVAIALMIAESRPEDKETMVSLVMNFLR